MLEGGGAGASCVQLPGHWMLNGPEYGNYLFCWLCVIFIVFHLDDFFCVSIRNVHMQLQFNIVSIFIFISFFSLTICLSSIFIYNLSFFSSPTLLFDPLWPDFFLIFNPLSRWPCLLFLISSLLHHAASTYCDQELCFSFLSLITAFSHNAPSLSSHDIFLTHISSSHFLPTFSYLPSYLFSLLVLLRCPPPHHSHPSLIYHRRVTSIFSFLPQDLGIKVPLIHPW